MRVSQDNRIRRCRRRQDFVPAKRDLIRETFCLHETDNEQTINYVSGSLAGDKQVSFVELSKGFDYLEVDHRQPSKACQRETIAEWEDELFEPEKHGLEAEFDTSNDPLSFRPLPRQAESALEACSDEGRAALPRLERCSQKGGRKSKSAESIRSQSVKSQPKKRPRVCFKRFDLFFTLNKKFQMVLEISSRFSFKRFGFWTSVNWSAALLTVFLIAAVNFMSAFFVWQFVSFRTDHELLLFVCSVCLVFAAGMAGVAAAIWNSGTQRSH